MTTKELLGSLVAAFRGERLKPTLILATAPPVMVAWWYFGSKKFFLDVGWPGAVAFDDARITAVVCQFLSCFVLLGIIPGVMVKLVFRERLRDYGLCLGDHVWTFGAAGVLVPVSLFIAWMSADDPAILAYYPEFPHAGPTTGMFAVHALAYLVFYVAWEFYFRGVMLFGTRQALGDVHAILLQTLASTMLHPGKPAAETFGAIAGGLVWGIVAIRSQSILAPLLAHAALGIGLEWFILFGGR